MAQRLKNLPAVQETQETRVWSLDREDSLEEEMAPILLFLPQKFHGQRILAGYNLRSPKVLDTTEWLSRKGRGTRDQFDNINLIIENTREIQKNIYFCIIDYVKAFVWITTNWEKFLKG